MILPLSRPLEARMRADGWDVPLVAEALRWRKNRGATEPGLPITPEQVAGYLLWRRYSGRAQVSLEELREDVATVLDRTPPDPGSNHFLAPLPEPVSTKLTHAVIVVPDHPGRVNGKGAGPRLSAPVVGGLAGPVLASMIRYYRPGTEIVFTDEIFSPIPWGRIAALPRAGTLFLLSGRVETNYEARRILGRAREMGFRTAEGGYFATACPDEVQTYADAAVVGEAEATVRELLRCFENGEICPRRPGETGLQIRATELADLRDPRLPFPDRGVYPKLGTGLLSLAWHLTAALTVEWSRYCPNRCSFCASTCVTDEAVAGRRPCGDEVGRRTRPWAAVLAQILSTSRNSLLDEHAFFLTDDNFFALWRHPATREACRTLLRKIRTWIPSRWGVTMTADAAQDPDFLSLFREAGGAFAFVGFESVTPAALREADKAAIDGILDPPRVVRAFHDRGIGVFGSLIFGFDSDTPEVFVRSGRTIEEAGFDVVNVVVLTPYPRTPLYEKMLRQGQVTERWWERSYQDTRRVFASGLTDNTTFTKVVFRPKGMDSRTLAAGSLWIGNHFNRFSRLAKNFLRPRAPFPFFTRISIFLAGRSYQGLYPLRDRYAILAILNVALAKEKWQPAETCGLPVLETPGMA